MAVIQEAWIQGVSTHEVDDLVQAMGMNEIPAALRLSLRAALLTFPPLVLRALFRPRQRCLAELTDQQLHYIGLTRGDVDRPQERTLSDEMEMYRMLRSRDWR